MYDQKSQNFSWNKKLAENIARKEGIILTSDHWEIIYLLRMLYKKFNTIPNVRMLILILKKKIW
jgi:tRNA 2-thiouridine synthesizing protein E